MCNDYLPEEVEVGKKTPFSKDSKLATGYFESMYHWHTLAIAFVLVKGVV